MRRPTLLLSFALVCPVAWACIHGPKDYEGEFHQEGQQALLVFDGGQQDLFLRPTVVFEGDAPAEIAWVIPVPSEPSHYAEDTTDAMASLIKAWNAAHAPPMQMVAREAHSEADSPTTDAPPPIEILEVKVAGDYTIQPIKARGEAGATALSEWLESNGFGAVPSENMRYYVEREWVWLCVKAKPKSKRAELAPLQITFATPRIVYPLKFSTHQGDLDLDLFVATKAACPELATEAKRYGMTLASETIELPQATQTSLHGAKLSGEATVARLRLSNLSGSTIEGWDEDFSLTPPGSNSPAAGESWGGCRLSPSLTRPWAWALPFLAALGLLALRRRQGAAARA